MNRRCWIIVCFGIMAAFASPAWAKRGAPAKIEPMVAEGVRYSIPNDEGRRAYLVASEEKSGRKLWELTLFTNSIDPNLEEDVQWVFIAKAKLDGGKLVAVCERGKTYRVDLAGKKLVD